MGALLALSGVADAQLVNTEFDTDLSGWRVTVESRTSWVDEDSNGNPSSGAVELTNPADGNGGVSYTIEQCINIENATFPYLMKASARVLSEGETGISANIMLWEHNGPDCTQFVGFIQFVELNQDSPVWESGFEPFTPAGPDTRSVAVRLGIRKEIGTGAGGRVQYDDLYFGNENNLFRDRFEGD
jgi:hypothetical protein